MPSMSLQTYAAWSNYHLTIGETPARGLPPAMTIEHMRRTYCADVDDKDPIKTMRETASVLLHALKQTEQDRRSRWGDREDEDVAAGVVGRGWSFSPLIGTPFAQLMAEGLSWISEIPANSRCKDTKKLNLCLCGGGTRLRELVSWAESQKNKRSIRTSGTHLGPTVAGTFGTASHGSRLGFGGFQNLIHGIHIITGDNRHIWLHRKGKKVLTKKAISQLKTEYTYKVKEPCEPDEKDEYGECLKRKKVTVKCLEIENDNHFNNALIHLGCMGIINAVALELTSIERFSVMGWKKKINKQWLKRVSKGDFTYLANELAPGSPKPEFYELTFDPQNPYSEPAAHLFYFSHGEQPPFIESFGIRPSPADAISQLAAEKLRSLKLEPEDPASLTRSSSVLPPPGPSIERVLRFLLKGQNTLLKAYLAEGGFKVPSNKINFGEAIAGGTWGSIHPDEISGGIPGALYNASFSIKLSEVPEAVEAITKAVQGLNPSFLFTLRFVDEPDGNLRFTRFKRNAVIEIDGLSRHICEQTIFYGRQRNRQGGTFTIFMEAALDLLASTVERGAFAVREALDDAGIDYSMHWAKLGDLDAKKVHKDFGRKKIKSWQRTRRKLLTKQGLVFFRNPAAKKYDLLPKL